jgi:superoxide dismutase, Cu-Zn family
MRLPRYRRVLLGAVVLALGIATLLFNVGASAKKTNSHRRGDSANAKVYNVDGTLIAKVHLREHRDKVFVYATAWRLPGGFHGFHVHSVGLCDPNFVDPTGARVPFGSAGGHYNPTGADHGAHAGDMPPLLVNADGRALAAFTTDRFSLDDLDDADGSAIIVHAGPDNLAHIPATTPTGAERYHSHVDNVFGPDTATRATGDAGGRTGCGVVK